MGEECLICKAPLEYLQEDIAAKRLSNICRKILRWSVRSVIKRNTVKQDVSMVIMYAMSVIPAAWTVSFPYAFMRTQKIRYGFWKR